MPPIVRYIALGALTAGLVIAGSARSNAGCRPGLAIHSCCHSGSVCHCKPIHSQSTAPLVDGIGIPSSDCPCAFDVPADVTDSCVISRTLQFSSAADSVDWLIGFEVRTIERPPADDLPGSSCP